MPQNIGLITFLVADYDEAIAFFVGKLGFELIEDTAIDDAKRWVIVAPPGASETRLLLARAATDAQRRSIGAQGGGRVFLFLYTDDFALDHAAMTARGVTFVEPPREEPYGRIAVFTDLYGHRWDLIERSA